MLPSGQQTLYIDGASMALPVYTLNELPYVSLASLVHILGAPAEVQAPDDIVITPREYVEPFVDVLTGRFYSDSVAWAVDKALVSGMTELSFDPEGTCTRGQVVTMLWRAVGKPEPTVSQTDFTDISPDRYYYKAVLWAVEEGITSGMTETTFEPDRQCTRGQIVTFLHRFAAGPETVSGSHSFTDLIENAYYYDAVLWAVEAEITKGITESTFVPEGSCTRGQVVTFLHRLMDAA